MHPDFSEAHVNLGENYVLQGKFPEGIREIRKGIELDTDSEYKATLVWAYMKSGDTKSAHAALNDLLKLAKSQYVYSYALANAYGFVGDKDNCLLWMERAFENRDFGLVWAEWYMELPVAIREAPRYREITKKVRATL